MSRRPRRWAASHAMGTKVCRYEHGKPSLPCPAQTASAGASRRPQHMCAARRRMGMYCTAPQELYGHTWYLKCLASGWEGKRQSEVALSHLSMLGSIYRRGRLKIGPPICLCGKREKRRRRVQGDMWSPRSGCYQLWYVRRILVGVAEKSACSSPGSGLVRQ